MDRISASSLRHRIDILEQQRVQNPSTGEVVIEWVVKASDVPADVHHLSARELITANTTFSKVTGRVVIRQNPELSLKPSMRVKHGEAIYNIVGIIPDNITGYEHYTLPVERIFPD